MSDTEDVFLLFPDLKPLAQQQNMPWTFYISNNETTEPLRVTGGRFFYVDKVLYADSIHIGPSKVGAARVCRRGHGAKVERVWVYFGDLAEVVARVLTPLDPKDG